MLGDLGNLHFEQGRNNESRLCFDDGEALLRKTNDPIELGKLLCKRARLAYTEDERLSAICMIEEAAALAENAGAEPTSELGRLLAETRALLEKHE